MYGQEPEQEVPFDRQGLITLFVLVVTVVLVFYFCSVVTADVGDEAQNVIATQQTVSTEAAGD
jgi:hypothetical protein